MFTLPSFKAWLPAVSTSDGRLAASSEVDVRIHLRKSAFVFDPPSGFEAIENESEQPEQRPGRCEKCSDGKISDGYGLCKQCPEGERAHLKHIDTQRRYFRS